MVDVRRLQEAEAAASKLDHVALAHAANRPAVSPSHRG